jgi:hypothetical protein
LLLPRLKPYAFGLGVVPLYLAAKPLRAERQLLLMVIACTMPFVAAAELATGHVPAAAPVLRYGQLFALASAYLLVRLERDV